MSELGQSRRFSCRPLSGAGLVAACALARLAQRSCSPALPARCTAYLPAEAGGLPKLRERKITFFVRW